MRVVGSSFLHPKVIDAVYRAGRLNIFLVKGLEVYNRESQTILCELSSGVVGPSIFLSDPDPQIRKSELRIWSQVLPKHLDFF